MATRLEFNTALKTIAANVYYQPPASIQLTYPCIVYEDAKPWTVKADNRLYLQSRAYSVTYITRQPIGEIDDFFIFLNKFPLAKFDRHFVVDNLHHYIYTIYY